MKNSPGPVTFVVLGVAQIIFHGKVRPEILFSIGGVLLLLGLVAPPLLRPFHFVWMLLAEGLGFVMNRVILRPLFFVFLSPGAIVIRLIGKDLLERNYRQRSGSYWVPKTEAVVEPEPYERQF